MSAPTLHFVGLSQGAGPPAGQCVDPAASSIRPRLQASSCLARRRSHHRRRCSVAVPDAAALRAHPPPPLLLISGTMPWQLPPELAERVQRARRLLAQSPEHAGSTELQVLGQGQLSSNRRTLRGRVAMTAVGPSSHIDAFSPSQPLSALQCFVDCSELTVELHRSF